MTLRGVRSLARKCVPRGGRVRFLEGAALSLAENVDEEDPTHPGCTVARTEMVRARAVPRDRLIVFAGDRFSGAR